MYILFTTLTIKHLVYVKGHPNNPHTQRILPRRDYAPNFEIPGSATGLDLKATDFQKCLTHIGVGTRCLRSKSGCGESCALSTPTL